MNEIDSVQTGTLHTDRYECYYERNIDVIPSVMSGSIPQVRVAFFNWCATGVLGKFKKKHTFLK